MKTGKRWSCWKARAASLLVALPATSARPGLRKDRASIERNLMAQQSLLRHESASENYRAGCPDVIDLILPERPELNGKFEIGPDGRIDLGDYGKVRVEGKTTSEISKLIAAETGSAVQANISEFRSQQLLLFGEVIGWQRSVSYRGQETVLELLQRVGGLTAGAEPRDVYVVRPHLGDNRRPEVIHVDLHAIVLNQDHRTNIRLQPFDQIYVGETRQAQIGKAIPPWMRRVYQVVWDTTPAAAAK